MNRLFLFCFSFLLVLGGLLGSAESATVYLTPQKALSTIFSTSSEVTSSKLNLTAEQLEKINQGCHCQIKRTNWSVYIAKTGAAIDGYAAILNEIGKTDPITFLVALNASGQVKDIEVLVYREPHGSEVTQKLFTKQFLNKDSSSILTVGKDIQHISGATLSSRAITRGVKKFLAVWKEIYGK